MLILDLDPEVRPHNESTLCYHKEKTWNKSLCCFMFFLCYVAAYLLSILMGRLVPRNASQGKLSLSHTVKMKLCSEVQSAVRGGRSAVTLTAWAWDCGWRRWMSDGAVCNPGWMMSVFVWLQRWSAGDWGIVEVLHGHVEHFVFLPLTQ